MKDYSNSEKELQRLEKLRGGVVRRDYRENDGSAGDRAEQLRRAQQKREDEYRENDGSASARAEQLRRLPLRGAKKAKKNISKINAVTNVASKIDWSNDGLYFVVFCVSVVGDVGTMAIGAVEAVPGGGWVLGLVFGMATRTFVIGVSVVIWLLYMMNGHYKRRMAIMKVAVLMGFSFLELMPIATALPGFIGSFVINYVIVLYGRAMDEVLSKSKAGAAISIVAGKKAAIVNEARKRVYAERANAWQGQERV